MAVNRPPTARPQQERARHFRTTSGVSNPRQPDTGPGCPSQDPGSTHHPNLSTRPVFYVPAPPPPQFLHYQWPIPFPYNPIAGFSGYGMVMPPFPPTPYMEAPSYVMPHPHVDYRQFLHPMVHAQCPPYQNPNQPRRFRGPFSFSVRQTTNSEVQTEPSEGLSSDKEGSVHGDSGTGTASCSPSCRSSSQKQDSVEVEKCSSPSVDMDVQRRGKSSPSSAENKAVESCRETSEKQNEPANVCNYENGPPCKNDLCNIWSVSSQDGMVPMCSSSQQEDESIQERHVSVSDILKCWRAGAPQEAIPKETEKELFHNEDQLAFKTHEQYEGPVCHTATKTGNGPRLLGYRRESGEVRAPLSKKSTDSQNEGARLSNDFNESQENDRRLHENASGSVSYKFPLSTPRVERKLNESVWSVESIGPFIPSKEWIMQNMPESQMVAEITGEPEDGLLKQYDIILDNCDGNQSLNPSTSDSAPMSGLIYSTPAQKTNPPQTPRRNSAQSPELTESPKEDPGMNPKNNEPLTCLQSDITPSGESGSPEVTANQNPNQNGCNDVQQVKIPCIADQRETPSSSLENIPSTAKCTEAVKSVPEVESNDDLSNHQLCVLLANPRTAEFSPGSMGHCFCIGCHCNKFHESKYPFEELKPNVGSKVKHRAVRKGISMKARIEKKYGPWRNKRLAKYNNHEE
ncbi:uncharacterized protein [Syngnathus scovelli]|uniref:uncharacterized protein isoform X2 n=1 Tax=Syngnathus scovelli TaxID=161590 RepID=UPI002110353A|nr:uncharacterized protein LOC125984898 isoform X2 [Syngnathus scovelli]